MSAADPSARRPELISVVIPVRNEARTLPDQLAALAGQTYGGRWELLVCDNGSVDGTRDVAASWQARLPQLRLVDASTRTGLNHARNVGVAAARGDYIAFCDGDDVATPGWLAALAEAAPFADLVAGAVESEHLNGADGPPHRGQNSDPLPLKHGFMAAVPGGNCGIWASVARELGWDERFTFGGSDIEFSWRAQLHGYRIGYAPQAMIHVRHRRRLVDTAKQWYLYGKSGAQLYRVFRSQGMSRSSVTAAARSWASLALHIGDLFGRRTRTQWVRKAAYRVGRLAGSLRAGVMFL